MSERDKSDKRPEQADEAVPSPDLEQAVASPVRDVEAEFDLAGESHRTPTAGDNAALPAETQTYGEITWEQFRKYRLAYASMWACVGLVLLAIYAPVIASDLPFALTVGDSTTYPWLANLFNKNYYENTVDIIFNSLMFLLPVGIALYIPATRVARRIRKRHAQRLKRRVMGVFALLFVVVDAWLIFDPLPGSSTLGIIIQGGLLFFGLGLVALFYARAMMEALGVAPERLQATRWMGIGVVALIGFALAGALSGTIDDVGDRPESPVLQSLGWYAWDFPLPGEELRRLNETRLDEIRAQLETGEPSATAIAESLEERDFSVAWPPVAYSFRGTSTDIEAPMTRMHPLGTDNIGRDVFARMIFGTRIALTIGIVAVGIYITLGVLLGALAGYFGGWVDWMILRFVEIMLCFPSLFLILTLASFVDEPSVFYVMLIIGVTRWTGPARLVRGEFLRLRNQEFVQAAKALGLPEWRIIFKHVLPNALGPVLVSATFGVASAILVESTISFLGMGDPSAPTWGKILNDGRVFRNNIMILMPGFAIFLTVSLFNLMGEGLRDALDPKMRR